jgi:hypothetical protein
MVGLDQILNEIASKKAILDYFNMRFFSNLTICQWKSQRKSVSWAASEAKSLRWIQAGSSQGIEIRFCNKGVLTNSCKL